MWLCADRYLYCYSLDAQPKLLHQVTLPWRVVAIAGAGSRLWVGTENRMLVVWDVT
jgi:hypothetical protein